VISEILGVEPILIDSKLVSAQKRQRLYWTNIPEVKQPKDKGINLKDIISGDHEIINDNDVVLGRACKDFIIKNGTNKGYLIAENGDGVNLEFPNSKTRRGRVSKSKINTLNCGCNYGVVIDGNLLKLNITDIERLQTIPDNYTEGVSENQRRKMIGNGWTVDSITHIFKSIN
jgi:DNA (cytosine-5)-methyltransferase 3A